MTTNTSTTAGIPSLLSTSNPSSLSPSPSASSSSLSMSSSLRLADDDSASALDLDRLPLEQLLHSQWFHQNISQMLNISVDNLTSLLINAQHQLHLHATANSSGVGSVLARDPPWILITLTTFYALIFAAGILGNLITCIVISKIKFMHTATNFYLFNLAVSDLILLLSGMPQELYNTWYPEAYPFNDVLCKMEGIFSETAANATVLTITAFTVERYIAICHPFRQHSMSKLSRAIKFIFAIWVTAFVLALPQAMQFSVVPQNDGLECTMENDFFAHVFAVSGFIFFGGPMTAICVLYVLIGMKLERSRMLQSLPRRCYDVSRGINAQSRVIRMLVAVAVAFFLCWAPFHAQRLMAAYGSTADVTSALFNEAYHVLNYISGVLYFLSTCINPLLYNIMSHKFREAFKVTLARKFGLSETYSTQNHRYSALLRQNGSLRMNTTVNNNAFDPLNSYRVVHLQCRDPTHHLSLQDSIRTNTTTTTISSASGCSGSSGSGASNNCRSSQRNRCIAIGGGGGGGGGRQSTLPKALSKKDAHSTSQRSNGEHRTLQTQFSQLSSMGDANSLLERDDSYHHRTPAASYRIKELRRSMTVAANGHAGASRSGGAVSATTLMDSTCFSQAQNARNPRKNADLGKPVAPQIMAATLVATQPVQPLHSIAELAVSQPTRSRKKLSRIISRRPSDVLVTQSPRVELMRRHLPGMGHQQAQSVHVTHQKRRNHSYNFLRSLGSRPKNSEQIAEHHKKQRKNSKTATKTLHNLTQRFRWRAKHTNNRKSTNGSNSDDEDFDKQRMRHSAAAAAAAAAATHTPTPAVMRFVYPTMAEAALNDDTVPASNGEAKGF